MSSEEKIYRNLQEHLDQQPIGYAAVESGADIRVLKHVFTPKDVRITSEFYFAVSYTIES